MRFRLLQARDAHDQVRHEELEAFARKLEVPTSAVEPYDLLAGRTSFAEVTDGVDAVLVGGSGAYSIYDDLPWITPFIDTLGALANEGFPTFASCFGFQGLVVALGGEVKHDLPNAEVGTFSLERCPEALDDPIFRELPATFDAQLGHKDRAFTLPSVVVNLVRSARCPYQAIRIDTSGPVYATQFHPELSHDENLLRFTRYKEQYVEAFGRENYQQMCDSFRPSLESSALIRQFRTLIEGGD